MDNLYLLQRKLGTIQRSDGLCTISNGAIRGGEKGLQYTAKKTWGGVAPLLNKQRIKPGVPFKY